MIDGITARADCLGPNVLNGRTMVTGRLNERKKLSVILPPLFLKRYKVTGPEKDVSHPLGRILRSHKPPKWKLQQFAWWLTNGLPAKYLMCPLYLHPRNCPVNDSYMVLQSEQPGGILFRNLSWQVLPRLGHGHPPKTLQYFSKHPGQRIQPAIRIKGIVHNKSLNRMAIID